MLDYLFIAELFNHTFIKQTQADMSRLKPGSSAFYDVMQQKVKRFSLVGKGHMITIDLVDGHAEVDGTVIHAPKPPPIGKPLNLIYYRQVQQRLSVEYTPGVSAVQTKLNPIVRYYIGWQCNYRGKNHKWELGID